MQTSAEIVSQLLNGSDDYQLARIAGRELVAHFEHGAAPCHAEILHHFAVWRGGAVDGDGKVRILAAFDGLLHGSFEQSASHSRISHSMSISALGCASATRRNSLSVSVS